MVGRHHQLSGNKFEQTPGDSGGQVSLVCCSPWSCRVGHDLALATEQQGYSKEKALNNIMFPFIITLSSGDAS